MTVYTFGEIKYDSEDIDHVVPIILCVLSAVFCGGTIFCIFRNKLKNTLGMSDFIFNLLPLCPLLCFNFLPTAIFYFKFYNKIKEIKEVEDTLDDEAAKAKKKKDAQDTLDDEAAKAKKEDDAQDYFYNLNVVWIVMISLSPIAILLYLLYLKIKEKIEEKKDSYTMSSLS